MFLGSRIQDLEKTNSGSRIQAVKKAPDPRSGSATLHDNSVPGKFGYHPGVLAESRKLETKK
jgi:hypothetical protein